MTLTTQSMSSGRWRDAFIKIAMGIIVAVILRGQTLRASELSRHWEYNESKSNYILTIRCDTNMFTPRDPVILYVTVMNVSTQTLEVGGATPITDFTFDISHEDGESAQSTQWYRQRYESETSGSHFGALCLPGCTRSCAFRLNALVDLSKPGIYRLQVRKRLIRDGPVIGPSTNSVVSNEIRIRMDNSSEEVESSKWCEVPLRAPYLKKPQR